MSEAARRRGPYRNGLKSREQIIAAATAAFAESGYAGTSLRRMATAVGMSPAALLQHFGSKEQLLMAVLDQWTQHTTTVIDVEGGLSYFRSFEDVMTFHIENRGLIELFLTMATEASSSSHPAHEFIKDRYAWVVAAVSHHLRAARDSDEIGPMTEEQVHAEARIFVAVLDGLELQWLLDADLDLRGLLRHHLDACFARWRTIGSPRRQAPDPGSTVKRDLDF